MRVLLAAGGSGGHIFPAVSLAQELEKDGEDEIYFVSSRRRLDKHILKGVKHKCFYLSVNPMPHSVNPVKVLVFIFKLLLDSVRSVFILVKRRPSCVVGFGGYSSGAVSLFAFFLGIPLVIHEQNLVPGRANKILSRIASLIAVSFKETEEYFKKRKAKIIFTGNPIRTGILTSDRAKSAEEIGVNPSLKTVLVMGGSQGSSFLNETMSEVALLIKKRNSDIQFIHLAGKNDFEKVKDFYRDNDIRGKVFSYLERIDEAYSSCDMAVSRAGAAALFELAFYSKPMVLVPYPNPKNNQRSNAIMFSQKGAAVYREEKSLMPDELSADILNILEDETRYGEMSRHSGLLAKPDAAYLLAEGIKDLRGNKK